MHIFHIVALDSWDAAVVDAATDIDGSYRPESLTTEGFIHFSYAEQVAATANRYYADVDGLAVLEVDPGLVEAELRVEPSPATGELFPHLYGPLPITAVLAIQPLLRDATGRYQYRSV